MNLTKPYINDYALPTDPQWSDGFGDSNNQGAIAMLRQVYGFFYVYSFMVGVMGGRKTCRFLDAVRQPVASTARGLATSDGGLKTIIEDSIMGNLIPFAQRFIAGISTRTVSARKLHEFLESKQDFSTWIKARIKQYGFEKNTDYLLTLHKIVERKPRGLQGKTEYFLTIDMAKELAMVERNEKGKQARRYFIDCEKQLLEAKQKQLVEIKEKQQPSIPGQPSAPIPESKDYKTARLLITRLRGFAGFAIPGSMLNEMNEDIDKLERCLVSAWTEMDEALFMINHATSFLERWRTK